MSKRSYNSVFNSKFDIREYPIQVNNSITDYNDLILSFESQIYEILKSCLEELSTIWFQLKIKIEFNKKTSGGIEESDSFWFILMRCFFNEKHEISSYITQLNEQLTFKISQLEIRGSGWIFKKIEQVLLQVSQLEFFLKIV